MSTHPVDSLLQEFDTIMRDEAYDGGFGPLSEEQFNNMCARVAGLMLEAVQDRELI